MKYGNSHTMYQHFKVITTESREERFNIMLSEFCLMFTTSSYFQFLLDTSYYSQTIFGRTSSLENELFKFENSMFFERFFCFFCYSKPKKRKNHQKYQIYLGSRKFKNIIFILEKERD